MKKIGMYLCFVLSFLCFIGFLQSFVTMIFHHHAYSAPLYIYMIEDIIKFLLPSLGCLMIGFYLRNEGLK